MASQSEQGYLIEGEVIRDAEWLNLMYKKVK